MKNWGTQEQKGEVLLMGASLLSNIFTELSEHSKENSRKINQAKSDGKFTVAEYEFLEQEYLRYKSYTDNLFGDCELNVTYANTKTYFLDIIWIIMLDEENDYHEILDNFTNFIDNTNFIKSHEEAVLLREERLDKEFEPILNQYNLEMQQYEKKMKEYNSRTLSKLWNSKPIEPKMPVRRS